MWGELDAPKSQAQEPQPFEGFRACVFLERVELAVLQHSKDKSLASEAQNACANYPFENCPHCGGLSLKKELTELTK